MPQQLLEGAPAPPPPTVKAPKPPKRDIPLALAENAANLVKGIIERDWGERVVVTIAGSIRRRRPVVHDVDIVVLVDKLAADDVIPGITKTCLPHTAEGKMRLDGSKLKAFPLAIQFHSVPAEFTEWSGDQVIPVELYITTEPNHWATILLIRTGSKDHNIKLTKRAQDKGWMLRAEGQGVVDNHGNGRVLAFASEEDILGILDCDHVAPETREA